MARPTRSQGDAAPGWQVPKSGGLHRRVDASWKEQGGEKPFAELWCGKLFLFVADLKLRRAGCEIPNRRHVDEASIDCPDFNLARCHRERDERASTKFYSRDHDARFDGSIKHDLHILARLCVKFLEPPQVTCQMAPEALEGRVRIAPGTLFHPVAIGNRFGQDGASSDFVMLIP